MRTKLIQYGGVALGSAAVDWIIFIGLSFLGIYHVVAIGFSRTLGGLFSFLMNRNWTFSARGGRHVTVQGRRFLLLYGVSYLLAIGTVYVLADIVGISVYLSKLGADGLCFVFNFVIMKIYVFHIRAGMSDQLKSALRRSG
jgi:putative flippase GtrA